MIQLTLVTSRVGSLDEHPLPGETFDSILEAAGEIITIITIISIIILASSDSDNWFMIDCL